MESYAKTIVNDGSYKYVGAVWSDLKNRDKFEEGHSLYKKQAKFFVIAMISEQSGPHVWGSHTVYSLVEYKEEFPDRIGSLTDLVSTLTSSPSSE